MKTSCRKYFLQIAIAAGLQMTSSTHATPQSCATQGFWFSTLFEQNLHPNWKRPVQGVKESFQAPEPEGKGPIDFTLSERSIGEDFLDYLEIGVDGLSLGQTIRLERFLLDNNKGLLNQNATLLDSRLLTDGFLPLMGAEPNYNETLDYIEIDLEAVTFRDGEILSYFPIRSGFEAIPGQYIYRVSSPSNAFEAQTNRLTIHTSETDQSFTGRVMHKNTPVTGAWVALLQSVGDGAYGHLRKVAVTDSEGHYTLYAPFADEFDLVAVAPGFVAPFSVGTGEYIEEEHVIERDLELVAGTRTLSGKVVDSATGEAIPGLPVTFLTSNAAGQINGKLFTHTWTDSEGKFSARVTPGIWGITFKSSDVSSRSYVTGLDRAVAVADTTESNIEDLVVPLTRGTCLIAGTLSSSIETDEDGEPLPLEGVEVMAFNQEHGLAASGVTYEDGWFNLAVPPGHWTVFPFSYDLETAYHPGSSSHDAYFTAADQSIELDIEASPIGGVLEGYVTTPDEAPVGRLRLVAFNTDGERLESVIQNSYESDGYYNFYLGTGNWFVFPDASAAADRELLFRDLPRVHVPTEGDAFDANWKSHPIQTEAPTGTLDWTLKDQSNNPVSNVKVHAMMTTSSGTVYDAFGRTNNEGIAHIPVIAGKWKIHASITDLLPHQKQELPLIEVDVTGEQTTAQQTALDYTDKAPVLTPAHRSDDREFFVMGRAEPGRRYRVEGSQDLDEWLTLGQVTAVEGEFTIKDALDTVPGNEESNNQSAFYRVTPLD